MRWVTRRMLKRWSWPSSRRRRWRGFAGRSARNRRAVSARHDDFLCDHADVYVACIERGLDLLGPHGVLAFVCADRWTLNRYGAPLRRLVADKYHVQSYVDLHQASPFESEVSAYPAIFSIGRQSTGPVMVARMATGAPAECDAIRAAIYGGRRHGAGTVEFYPTWFEGEGPGS
jgi:adenine-specific DNA-methyltransferase